LILLFTFCFFTCDDILEVDISDEEIAIYSPQEGAVIEGTEVIFSWEILEDADQYTIQVFNEQNAIVLDSTVTSNIFEYNDLDEETYTWKMKAENFAYETDYTELMQFTLTPNFNLEEQEVSLESPDDNFYTNDISNNRFSWDDISTATTYDFEILDAETNTILYSEDNITLSELNIDDDIITEDDTYIWQVRANNETSSTEFSTRTFIVDTQEPSTASISAPTDSETFQIDEEISFEWAFDDEDNITSTIEISNDESFTDPFIENDITENSFTYTLTEAGTYYWKIKGTDEAGNEGDYNSTQTFVIEE